MCDNRLNTYRGKLFKKGSCEDYYNWLTTIETIFGIESFNQGTIE